MAGGEIYVFQWSIPSAKGKLYSFGYIILKISMYKRHLNFKYFDHTNDFTSLGNIFYLVSFYFYNTHSQRTKLILTTRYHNPYSVLLSYVYCVCVWVCTRARHFYSFYQSFYTNRHIEIKNTFSKVDFLYCWIYLDE